MADDQVFAMPPSETPAAPPAEGEEANDGGFTLLGDAPAPAADPAPFVGDVTEAPPADMGFAAEPVDAGFAAPPADDAFAAPPAEDAPIP